MGDKYFDLAEKVRYSDHLLATIPAYQSLHPIVDLLIEEHRAIRDKLQGHVTGTQDSRSGLSVSQKGRRSLDVEVADSLESLYHALRSAEGKAVFDFKRFFPTGTLGDIGRNITDRKAALERCLTAITANPGIPGAADWKATLTDLQGRYNPKVDEGSSLESRKRTETGSLRSARVEWRRHYLAVKRIMEGLLIRAKREEEYTNLFLDLQKPAPAETKKSTEKPAAEASQGNGSSAEGSGTAEASSGSGSSAAPPEAAPAESASASASPASTSQTG